MTPRGLSRALFACLGIGAVDVAALNLAVLPALRAPATPDVAPAPVVAAKTMEPPPAPAPVPVAPAPAPAPEPPKPEPIAVAAVAPEPTPEPIIVPDHSESVAVVEFEKDSRRVGLRATWTLHKLHPRLARAPELLVVGHADQTGTPDINERLSVERAEAVARRLRELGIAQARVRVEGRGDREPRGAGNDRRVEIFIGGTP